MDGTWSPWKGEGTMGTSRDRYVFPAIFDYAPDGISVEFPDLPGCLTCGSTDEEALSMAKEALGLHLWGMERDGDEIPAPTPVQSISRESNQSVMLIEVWMPLIRNAMDHRAVKKTLTLPKWLNDAAEQEHINFSQVLQRALRERLGVTNFSHHTEP